MYIILHMQHLLRIWCYNSWRINIYNINVSFNKVSHSTSTGSSNILPLIFTDNNVTKTVPTVVKNFDIHQYMNYLALDNIDNDYPSENHIQEDQIFHQIDPISGDGFVSTNDHSLNTKDPSSELLIPEFFCYIFTNIVLFML